MFWKMCLNRIQILTMDHFKSDEQRLFISDEVTIQTDIHLKSECKADSHYLGKYENR